MTQIPEHHLRYARAWRLHQSQNWPDNLRRILENEMDSAQNHFAFDEFQEFKDTLPGYQEYWDGFVERFLHDLLK